MPEDPKKIKAAEMIRDNPELYSPEKVARATKYLDSMNAPQTPEPPTGVTGTSKDDPMSMAPTKKNVFSGLRSAIRANIPFPEDIKNFKTGVVDPIQQDFFGKGLDLLHDPSLETAGELGKSFLPPIPQIQEGIVRGAKDQYGKTQTAIGKGDLLGTFAHAGGTLVPMIGPPMADASDVMRDPTRTGEERWGAGGEIAGTLGGLATGPASQSKSAIIRNTIGLPGQAEDALINYGLGMKGLRPRTEGGIPKLRHQTINPDDAVGPFRRGFHEKLAMYGKSNPYTRGLYEGMEEEQVRAVVDQLDAFLESKNVSGRPQSSPTPVFDPTTGQTVLKEATERIGDDVVQGVRKYIDIKRRPYGEFAKNHTPIPIPEGEVSDAVLRVVMDFPELRPTSKSAVERMGKWVSQTTTDPVTGLKTTIEIPQDSASAIALRSEILRAARQTSDEGRKFALRQASNNLTEVIEDTLSADPQLLADWNYAREQWRLSEEIEERLQNLAPDKFTADVSGIARSSPVPPPPGVDVGPVPPITGGEKMGEILLSSSTNMDSIRALKQSLTEAMGDDLIMQEAAARRLHEELRNTIRGDVDPGSLVVEQGKSGKLRISPFELIIKQARRNGRLRELTTENGASALQLLGKNVSSIPPTEAMQLGTLGQIVSGSVGAPYFLLATILTNRKLSAMLEQFANFASKNQWKQARVIALQMDEELAEREERIKELSAESYEAGGPGAVSQPGRVGARSMPPTIPPPPVE